MRQRPGSRPGPRGYGMADQVSGSTAMNREAKGGFAGYGCQGGYAHEEESSGFRPDRRLAVSFHGLSGRRDRSDRNGVRPVHALRGGILRLRVRSGEAMRAGR